MRQTMLLIAVTTCLISTAASAQWTSGSLFSWGPSGWSDGGNGNNFFFSGSVMNVRANEDSTLFRPVSVIPGKHYRIQSNMLANRVNSGTYRVRVQATGIAATSWINTNQSGTPSATGIATGSPTQFRLEFDKTSGSSSAEGIGQWGSSTWIRQVVNNPQMSLQEDAIRINTDTPGGATAMVPLTPESLSFADEPTDWLLDWGDGNSITQPTLGTAIGHVYSIQSGDSQSWITTLSGSNQSGTGQDKATIELLRQPDATLLLNESVTISGSVIQIDIGTNPTLDLSLASSIGFIEEASFEVPGLLAQSGSSLVFSGTLFDQTHVGMSFSLIAVISNSGLGANSDNVQVTLQIVQDICAGDCDGSGTVDFNDLVAMLFEFGNTTDGPCDADGTGFVNFNDLTTTLFQFGPCE